MHLDSIRKCAGFVVLAIILLTLPGPAFAGGASLPPLVRDIGYCLLLAGLLAVVFVRLKIPSIAGFLVAGLIAGPQGLGLVTEPENIDTIAQLGFVLLLFMIGLEIDVRKILNSGRTIITVGLLQYPLGIGFGLIVALALDRFGIGGAILDFSPYAPLYFGIAIAGSSTLLVVKLFSESFGLDTLSGRSCVGLLIFEDIWAIIIIALQPSFSQPSIGPVVGSFLGIAVLTALAVGTAHLFTRRAFRWIAKSPELILVGALSWCFIVLLAGMNFDAAAELVTGFTPHMAVGPGMGALIAGVSLANSPFSTEIVTKVGTVRDFFIVLFFVGLGMSIPMPDSTAVVFIALALAAATVVSRLLLGFPLLYATGLDRRNALVSSIRLGQISEFALVVVFLGLQLGHVDPDFNSAVILAFVATALATPSLFHNAHAVYERTRGLLDRIGIGASTELVEEAHLQTDLVLLGFHRVASSLLHDISVMNPHLAARTLVVDFNVALHEGIRAAGARVLYGNLANVETLRHADIGHAKVIALTIPDEILVGTTNLKTVKAVRGLAPDAVVIACATRLDDVDEMYAAGADFVFLPRLESARSLSTAIAEALNGQIRDYRMEQDASDFPARLRDEVFR